MKKLTQKRANLLAKLNALGPVVRGSITQVCSTCNRANCICNVSSSKRAHRLTYKDAKQKTKTVYIPRGRLRQVRKMLANYKRMRHLSEQLIEINIEIFKSESKDSR